MYDSNLFLLLRLWSNAITSGSCAHQDDDDDYSARIWARGALPTWLRRTRKSTSAKIRSLQAIRGDCGEGGKSGEMVTKGV